MVQLLMTQHFHCCGLSSIPGQGIKIPGAMWYGRNRANHLYCRERLGNFWRLLNVQDL